MMSHSDTRRYRHPAAGTFLTLAALTGPACATHRTSSTASPALASWTAQVDWRSAGDEAALLLSRYLQIKTVNPPGNEAEGARFLAGVLSSEGISSEVLEFAPGRGSLMARLEGRGDEPPLCLLSHIDVVGAEADHWDSGKGPFSGAIEGGYVFGRGALDMKGMGILELMTVIWLRRLQVPLRRDVILLAVGDEEVANTGIRDLVAHHWGRIGCSHVINEGGIGIRDLLFEGQTVFPISVGEKGILWVRMTAHGVAGHGSTPLPDQAPDRLLRALRALSRRSPKPTFHPAFFELLEEAGRAEGGLSGLVLESPALVRTLLRERLMENPLTRAALTDTVNLTGLSGGSSPNVVPSEASAILDCRLLPGTKPRELLAELRDLVGDPAISFEIISEGEANESPRDDPLYRALSRNAVGDRKDAAAGPVISVGFTDSLLLRPLGVRAYGFVPFEVSSEEAKTMHGHNERVSIENLRSGLRILFASVIEVAAIE